ncbi:MAG: NUDIX domain-containing protein [Paracoccaceae bacterium]
MSEASGGVAIRDAASVVVLRRQGGEARVLMGQRGAGAAFMPSKWVFPGGALDPADRDAAQRFAPPEALAERLGRRPRGGPERDPSLGAALALAALRELSEETGLAPRASASGSAEGLTPAWSAYLARHGAPNAAGLVPLARAITPPGGPRRFDARFVALDAAEIEDPDDFAGADGELSHLAWLPLAEARAADLPFVTALVLAEIEARLADDGPEPAIPFFRHEAGRSYLDPL